MSGEGSKKDTHGVGSHPQAEPTIAIGSQTPGGGIPDAHLDWDVGHIIADRYEVKEVLGEGGMGKVFRVYDSNWELEMAVKCPKAESFKTIVQKENFLHECHVWMDLGLHPHIVTCHYTRVLDGAPRVFAEYVSGGTLKDWIDSRKLYSGGKDAYFGREHFVNPEEREQ